MQKKKKVLIITSSGGGGLIQAAIAQKQKVLHEDPSAEVIVQDLLLDWIGGPFGRGFVRLYNFMQQSGHIAALELYVNMVGGADYIFWPIVYHKVWQILKREKVDQVINTQPVAISAILQSIARYNKNFHKKLIMQEIIVDLPTKHCTHFFNGIRRLSDKKRKLLQPVSLEPLLENESSAEAFWQKYCRLSEKDVVYEKYPIRQSFMQYLHQDKPNQSMHILIRTPDEGKKKKIQKCLEKSDIAFLPDEEGFKFLIDHKDKVFVVLLGSQASSATFDYVKSYLTFIKKHGKNEDRYFLFVFSDASLEKSSPFQKIVELIEKEKKYPKQLIVIPMPFQKDDVIAPLFYRSDVTISRSGGHTLMELMGVAHGQTWVHSEAKSNDKELSYEDLLKGIPGWESANANYFCKKNGAKLVTPKLLEKYLLNLFS